MSVKQVLSHIRFASEAHGEGADVSWWREMGRWAGAQTWGLAPTPAVDWQSVGLTHSLGEAPVAGLCEEQAKPSGHGSGFRGSPLVYCWYLPLDSSLLFNPLFSKNY